MSYFRPEIESTAGYVPGEQPQDGEFIKLNTNENPYPPSPDVCHGDRGNARRLRKYPDPMAGEFAAVRVRLLGVAPDWILCGNGSDDILTIVTRTFVGQGQLCDCRNPSYILYKTLAELQGARSEEVRFNADWSLPAEFAKGRDDLRVVFLPIRTAFGHDGSAAESVGDRRAVALPFVGR